jgi:hypothetical protein
MKKTLVTLGIALALALSARADVLVYKLKQTYTLTGYGGQLKDKHGGFDVLDPDTGELYEILTYTRNGVKYFSGYFIDNYFLDEVDGGAKRYGVFSIDEGHTDELGTHNFTLTGKGLIATGLSTKGRTWRLPKAITFTARKLSPTESGEVTLAEWAGTMGFDQKASDAYNASGGNLQHTIDQIKQSLVGYTEE